MHPHGPHAEDDHRLAAVPRDVVGAWDPLVRHRHRCVPELCQHRTTDRCGWHADVRCCACRTPADGGQRGRRAPPDGLDGSPLLRRCVVGSWRPRHRRRARGLCQVSCDALRQQPRAHLRPSRRLLRHRRQRAVGAGRDQHVPQLPHRRPALAVGRLGGGHGWLDPLRGKHRGGHADDHGGRGLPLVLPPGELVGGHRLRRRHRRVSVGAAVFCLTRPVFPPPCSHMCAG
mmetsp:Transcript_93688/g.262092  ORF Transcript_93688/g.262092 Transcript_93688/m.262092 type:complete len:230 (+) Transcript_93688:1150-1839(+)